MKTHEQFDKLAEQCYVKTGSVQTDHFDYVKFAELIVRECATAITEDALAKDCGTFMMDSWAKGMRYSAHLIKEHFGVKE